MTASQQTINDTSPFYVGEREASEANTASVSYEVPKQPEYDPWAAPQAPETLIEDSNAAEVHEAFLEAPIDPESYTWYDIGEIKSGGIYVGTEAADSVTGDDLQVARRKSDGQLLVRRIDSDSIMEVRNTLGRPYGRSAKDAAYFIARFSGYDVRGMKRKFAQSEIMNG